MVWEEGGIDCLRSRWGTKEGTSSYPKMRTEVLQRDGSEEGVVALGALRVIQHAEEDGGACFGGWCMAVRQSVWFVEY